MRPEGCAYAPRPRHLLRGRKSPGEVWGAAGGSVALTSVLTSSPHPHFLKQMSPIDELEVRSSRTPPPPGWRLPAGGREPSPAHSQALRLSLQPGKAAAWGPSPGTGRLASGAPARQPSRPPQAGDRRPRALRGLGRAQLARPGAGAGSQGLPGRLDPPLSGLQRSRP